MTGDPFEAVLYKLKAKLFAECALPILPFGIFSMQVTLSLLNIQLFYIHYKQVTFSSLVNE